MTADHLAVPVEERASRDMLLRSQIVHFESLVDCLVTGSEWKSEEHATALARAIESTNETIRTLYSTPEPAGDPLLNRSPQSAEPSSSEPSPGAEEHLIPAQVESHTESTASVTPESLLRGADAPSATSQGSTSADPSPARAGADSAHAASESHDGRAVQAGEGDFPYECSRCRDDLKIDPPPRFFSIEALSEHVQSEHLMEAAE